VSGLPRISGRDCAGALEKVGFALKRQRGSQMIFHRNKSSCQLVAPDHKELEHGRLRAIIRQAVVIVEQFNDSF
jgi:predicted RNA binding protein YcfA (HicA-like mRNA interferase family)